MVIRSCKMQTVMKPNLYASLDMIPEIGMNGSIQWLKHNVREANIKLNKVGKAHDNAITT